MRSGIVHHKSDRKPCVIPTADRNKGHPSGKYILRKSGVLLMRPKVPVKAQYAFSSKLAYPVKGISFMDGVGHHSKPYLEFRNAEAFTQAVGKR